MNEDKDTTAKAETNEQLAKRETERERDFRDRWRVGMHVLYKRPDGPHAGEDRPAVITRVNVSNCNLNVFLDGPNDSNTYDPAKSPTCEWRGSIEPGEEPNTFREVF